MDSTIASMRPMSCSDGSEFPACCISLRPPGIIPSTFSMGPRLRTWRSWSTKSSMVSRPANERSMSSCACFSDTCSCARSTSVSTSPMPRIRDAMRSGANGSRSDSFSPVPEYMIGLPIVSRMESAAPPRASPSSLVRMTPSTPTASSKPRPTLTASCPVIESTTSTVSFTRTV